MYQGKETRILIEQATAIFFEFVNSIVDRGGIEINFGSGLKFIRIEVLFVADLKMVPLVFGVSHSSSNSFCPMCFVQRKDHKTAPCSGQPRNPSTDEQRYPPLLNVAVRNIVCPPLHIIQELTNKIFETMSKAA
jgi:hypothetical protein